MTTSKKFGLTTYSEPAQTGGGNRRQSAPVSDDERFEFLRLKDGENYVRIITDPYKFYQVRFKLSESEKGWGKKIRCSAPVEDDPAVKAGSKPKERWLVGVIDRSDGQVRIWDYHVLVYNQLKALNDNAKWGDPQGFDICINFNGDAAVADQIRIVQDPKEPLSATDVALRDKVLENLLKALERHSAPLNPATVLAEMKKAGWKEGTTVASNGSSESKKLPATDEDDYSFEQPTAQA